MAKGYQSFTQKSTRTVYCSKEKYSSHAKAAVWVAAALAHFGIQASDTKNYKYPLDNQPPNATIYPA